MIPRAQCQETTTPCTPSTSTRPSSPTSCGAGRKTATIRLGDKSGKYRKGMIVQVLAGARFSPREKIFDAVIDKVEVKLLADLSPREIEHDNPEIRRPEEMAQLPRPALQPRGRPGRHGHGDPLLRDHAS